MRRLLTWNSEERSNTFGLKEVYDAFEEAGFNSEVVFLLIGR